MSEVDNDIEVEIKPQIFWLEDFEGGAVGGYFVRNPLKEFFVRLKEEGLEPVGIKFDNSYNLEILVKQ